ncbi:MAG: DUF1952 domain-containing protein [Chloroflexota bacterium]|jgi:hypothetical protein
MAAGPITQVREVRGIPLWLLQKYLVESGGTAIAEGQVQADGWQATLEQIEDFQIGSLRVGQVRLTITGTAASLHQLNQILEVKLLRAGG